jgi:hypothetical protein
MLTTIAVTLTPSSQPIPGGRYEPRLQPQVLELDELVEQNFLRYDGTGAVADEAAH